MATPFERQIRGISFAPDGKTLVTVARDNTVQIYASEDSVFNPVHHFTTTFSKQNTLQDVAHVLDSTTFVLVSLANHAEVYEYRNFDGDLLKKFRSQTFEIDQPLDQAKDRMTRRRRTSTRGGSFSGVLGNGDESAENKFPFVLGPFDLKPLDLGNLPECSVRGPDHSSAGLLIFYQTADVFLPEERTSPAALFFAGETCECHCSLPAEITIEKGPAREKMGIPDKAKTFVFVYPCLDVSKMTDKQQVEFAQKGGRQSLLAFGGFLYLSLDNSELVSHTGKQVMPNPVVSANSIFGGSKNVSMKFEPSDEIPKEEMQAAMKDGPRFFPVTLSSMKHIVDKFAWLPPGCTFGNRKTEHGAFVYVSKTLGYIFEIYKPFVNMSTNGVSHGKTQMITVATDKNLRVYQVHDKPDGQQAEYQWKTTLPSGHTGNVTAIAHCHASEGPMSEWYCTGSADKTVRVFESKKHDCVLVIKTLFTIAVSFPCNLDSTACRIVTLCINRSIHTFDLEDSAGKLKQLNAGIVDSGFSEFACGISHSRDGMLLGMTGDLGRDMQADGSVKRTNVVRLFNAEAICFTFKRQLSKRCKDSPQYYNYRTALQHNVLHKLATTNEEHKSRLQAYLKYANEPKDAHRHSRWMDFIALPLELTMGRVNRQWHLANAESTRMILDAVLESKKNHTACIMQSTNILRASMLRHLAVAFPRLFVDLLQKFTLDAAGQSVYGFERVHRAQPGYLPRCELQCLPLPT